jgi:hypothetical protein
MMTSRAFISFVNIISQSVHVGVHAIRIPTARNGAENDTAHR